MIEPSSSTPEIMLGSRSSAAGMLRLSGKDAPEHERPRLLREFFERRGIRYEIEPLGGAPVEIDLTIHVLPGLNLLSARLLGARYRRMRESDCTDDVGLMLNPGGTLHLSQRGKDIVLGEGEATLLSLTDPRRASEKISTIAFDAGFGDVSYFNRVFRQRYGDTPSGVRTHALGANA